MSKLALGLDYGTNSVRALLVETETGAEFATAVYEYPSGEEGILLDSRDPNLARQNPSDYIEGFVATVREVLKGVDARDIVGIGVDTTGSSPLPVRADGQSLAVDFPNDLASYCWLWKDHTGHAEAAEITELAKQRGEPYLAKCGGTYSSEWFWSKILRCARVAPEIFAAADCWVECCDWITGQITGNSNPRTLARSICAAGHKAMFADAWGGLPSKEFLAALDPRLADLRDRLYDTAVTSDHRAGGISADIAARTGLIEGTPVAVGAFDAHFGAVASGAKPGVLVKIIGTSTCDCMVHPLNEPLADVPGLCGIVPGSVLPGYYGLEAGQSAVGDIFNWFVRFCGQSHETLTEAASRLQPGESGLLALDWNNGNRTILVDPLLTGLTIGQTLYTTPGEVYRTLIEATAFGAFTIINRLEEYGVRVEAVVNCGGIAEKSPLVMQIYADICNRPMRISRSAQTCALGSAIFGSVVGGAHANVADAQVAMTGIKETVYEPNPQAAATYARIYKLYRQVHDAFGLPQPIELGNVMKDLIAIRDEVRHVA